MTTQKTKEKTVNGVMIFAVIVSAMGYFVDLYDIVIFGVVRVASLTELGFSGEENTRWGVYLLNLQMIGMLIGGIFWGIIADKLGRRTTLIATIAVYSLANIFNAFVTSVEQYAVLRFIAGVGLAGELGAGVALISESMPKKYRGYGVTVISVLGMCGALFASYVGSGFDWRNAYLVGGLMGIAVLFARWIGLRESELFLHSTHQKHRGDLRVLLKPELLLRLIAVIVLGVPIWFVSGLFVNFAPEFGNALGMTTELKVADVLRWEVFGLALGSALTGMLSERLQSRKKVHFICIFALIGLLLLLVFGQDQTPQRYVYLMFWIGLAQGYWTVFVIFAAEQFGTNMRGTVSTAVPNFVRAAVVPVTLGLLWLMPSVGVLYAASIIGAVVFVLALWALWYLPETWGKSLDFES